MAKKVDELKAKKKLRCKLYHKTNKDKFKKLKIENELLQQEIGELKIKLSIYNELIDVRNNKKTAVEEEPDDDDEPEAEKETDNDDNETVKTDDIEPNYDELFNEIENRTRNFHPVFIKDYERHMAPNLKKYQCLFIYHIYDKTLYNKRVEWLKNFNFVLDGDDEIEYEVYYQHIIEG